MLRELELPGVFLNEPTIHADDRGAFHEWFKASDFERAVGHAFALRQSNMSTSRAGVLRGLHYAEVPPGQAKYVVCPVGKIFDVAVDIRVGSPHYGQHVAVELSAENRHGVYIPDGFAHGFVALEDSVVVYLTTSEYAPGVEHTINPYDTELAIPWPGREHILSARDAAAPGLGDSPLPRWEARR